MKLALALIIGIAACAPAANVALVGSGTFNAPGWTGAAGGQAFSFSIRYDDATPGTPLGGVGTTFNSPTSFTVVTSTVTWTGRNPAPPTASVTFNDEAVEDSLIFGVPAPGATFESMPAGTALTSMLLEIVGFSPWFTGTALIDLGSTDYALAETATLTLSNPTEAAPLTGQVDLNSVRVIPEPRTIGLLLSAILLISPRHRPHS